jgi:predicted nuclease with RNAse H fold
VKIRNVTRERYRPRGMQTDAVRTLGVDLSAEPKKTAVAVLEWCRDDAVVVALSVGASDDAVVGLAGSADKVGIDCPLGWPEPFIDFVTAHRDHGPLAAHDLAGRRNLAYRATDLTLITDPDSPNPLSVSADRIGHAAMRAAGLLAALAKAGHDVDRAGGGLVVEAYPAAALKRWGLAHGGYKGSVNHPARGELLTGLTKAAPWLDLGAFDAACRASDDALDAVICALIARAVGRGKATTPGRDQAASAATEGWIAVPTCDLVDLLD